MNSHEPRDNRSRDEAQDQRRCLLGYCAIIFHDRDIATHSSYMHAASEPFETCGMVLAMPDRLLVKVSMAISEVARVQTRVVVFAAYDQDRPA